MLKLNGVSFIGIDKDTKFDDVVAFSKQERTFEFLEFGILYSNDRMGAHQRYPSKEYIEDFMREYKALKSIPFYTSIHLCGNSIEQFLSGDYYVCDLVSKFDRVQLNFKASDYEPETFFERLLEIDMKGCIPIVQANKSKQAYTDYLLANDERLSNWPIHVLYDGSGGFGRKLEHPPFPLGQFYCGYAGGIGPDTVMEIIPKIEQAMKYSHKRVDHYYIDMESQIRTENVFDLSKCQSVMDTVKYLEGLKIEHYSYYNTPFSVDKDEVHAIIQSFPDESVT